MLILFCFCLLLLSLSLSMLGYMDVQVILGQNRTKSPILNVC